MFAHPRPPGELRSTRTRPARSPGRSCPRPGARRRWWRPCTGFVAALFTSTSSAPNRSRVAATQAAAWSGSPAFAAKVATRAPGTAFCDRDRGLVEPGLLAGGEHHRGAAVGERRRDRPADALRRPGHDRNPPLQFMCHDRQSRARRWENVRSGSTGPSRDPAVPARAASRVHPRARWPPRGRGRRRPAVPRRPAVDPGWLPRRRRVLRDQRLPDHVPAAVRLAAARRASG